MESFAFEGHVVRLYRDGTSEVIEPAPGPPQRIDGFTVGAEVVSGPSPHRGELHPDGDELLYVLSGRMHVIVDDGEQDRVGTETAPARTGRRVRRAARDLAPDRGGGTRADGERHAGTERRSPAALTVRGPSALPVWAALRAAW